MHSILTALPAIVLFLIFLLLESRKSEPQNAAPGKLPVMLLLLIPLTAGFTFLYYRAGLAVSHIAVPFGKVLGTILILFVMAFVAYILLLLTRGLAWLLRLTKKDRLISFGVMLVLFAAEIILYYAYVSGGF